MKYILSLQWVYLRRMKLLRSILAAFGCGFLAAISAWAVGPMLAVSVGAGGTLTFSPRTAAALVNTQATWTVATGTHTITSDEGLFDSGTLTQGGVFSFTFTKPGTYNYHCNFHVSFGMVGTITVPGSAHDANGDNFSDIAWRNTNGDTSIWLMNGGQVLSAVDLNEVPTSWSIVGQRDFNGDGKSDLLWSNTNGDTSIWLMNGTQVSTTLDLGIVGNGWSIVGTGDFNGDGFGDILWRNTNGDTSIWLMTGTATQVQVLSTTDLGLVPTSWSVAQTGDFNGDGKADILWHNTDGDTSIWLMTVSGTQMQVLSVTDLGLVPMGWNIAGTGDFNGDGKSDILWHNTNGDTSIWLMTPNGMQMQVLSTTDFGIVPPSWAPALTGDFNGDGKGDILWRNMNGDTSIWFMTKNGTQVQVLSVSDLGVVPPSWIVKGMGAD
jgi:plastocyanin